MTASHKDTIAWDLRLRLEAAEAKVALLTKAIKDAIQAVDHEQGDIAYLCLKEAIK